MKTPCILSLLALPGMALLMGCSQQATNDSEKAAKSAANTLADVAKTIQSVSETADQVKDIGTRIKNFKGVEIRSYAEWEYKVVSLTGGVAESDLNEFGKEGWELTTRQGDSLIFKRRKAIIISDKPKPQPEDNEQ